MFRFADRGTVYWPVPLRQNDDTGNVVEVTVHIGYALLSRKDLRARERAALERFGQKDLAAVKDVAGMIALADAVTEREDGDTDFLVKHVTGWRGFSDADNQPLAFTPDRLRALLEIDAFYKPVMVGLHEASRAGPLKNSLPGPGGTPAPAQA